MEKKKSYAHLVSVEGHKYYFRNPESGKIYYNRGRIKFSCKTTKIQDAIDFAQARFLEQQGMTKGTAGRAMAGGLNPFLKNLWPEFTEHISAELDASTLLKYGVNWRHGISGFWENKQVGDINEENILGFKTWYLKTKPKRYFVHTKAHLRQFFLWLKAQRYIRQVPSFEPLNRVEEVVIKNSRRKAPDRRLADFEVDDLLRVASTSIYPAGLERGHLTEPKKLEKSHRAYLGILFGVRAGMRKMEAISLKWENVDFTTGIANVWSTKNKKWREVPLVPEILQALKKQRLLVGKSEYIFPKPSDPTKHMSSQIFDKVWIRCKKQAGITIRTRFHDLRHTFASITADEGWPPVVACQVLDMSLQIYTKTYCKASTEKKMELMQATFGTKIVTPNPANVHSLKK